MLHYTILQKHTSILLGLTFPLKLLPYFVNANQTWNNHGNMDETDSNPPDPTDLKKEKVQSNWRKLFRPWKWKRKKKSENFTRTASSKKKVETFNTLGSALHHGLSRDQHCLSLSLSHC